ncbi:hypothetical protein QMK93_29405, partial [Klebsiella pneumoniae]|uniref:hypothetical protein n=2 Tax=Klebsiella pneumoniae TaxID=573 RepID=UPI001D0DF773
NCLNVASWGVGVVVFFFIGPCSENNVVIISQAKNANIRVEGTFCFFRGGSAGVVLSPYPLPWHTIHIKVTDVSEDI